MTFQSKASAGSSSARPNPKGIAINGINSSTIVYTVPKGRIFEFSAVTNSSASMYIDDASINMFPASGSYSMMVSERMFMTEGQTLKGSTGNMSFVGVEYDV